MVIRIVNQLRCLVPKGHFCRTIVFSTKYLIPDGICITYVLLYTTIQ